VFNGKNTPLNKAQGTCRSILNDTEAHSILEADKSSNQPDKGSRGLACFKLSLIIEGEGTNRRWQDALV
jgi:hypothetical protein